MNANTVNELWAQIKSLPEENKFYAMRQALAGTIGMFDAIEQMQAPHISVHQCLEIFKNQLAHAHEVQSKSTS